MFFLTKIYLHTKFGEKKKIRQEMQLLERTQECDAAARQGEPKTAQKSKIWCKNSGLFATQSKDYTLDNMFLIFFWIERDYKYIQIHIKHKIYDKFSLKLLNGQLGYFGFLNLYFSTRVSDILYGWWENSCLQYVLQVIPIH